MTDADATPAQPTRLGRKFGEALANFEDLGRFMSALDNAMPTRTYNWTADRLEAELDDFITAGVSKNPPYSHNTTYRRLRDERIHGPDPDQ